MAEKVQENAGLESGKVTPEQLVEAIRLVGDFAKNDPEGALKLVQASLAKKNRADSTTPGVSKGSFGGASVPGSGASF